MNLQLISCTVKQHLLRPLLQSLEPAACVGTMLFGGSQAVALTFSLSRPPS